MNRNSGSPGLTDLVDLDILQRLQDDFAAATDVSATIMDLSAEPITMPSNAHRLCHQIIRGTEEGERRCRQSDMRCGLQAAQTRRPAIHTCHAGLTDFAVPIEVDQRLVAYMFGGQVLPGEPDPGTYRRKAEELGRDLGFDPEEYLEALEEIPILSMDRIEAAARLMHTVANTISDMANQRIKARQRADDWATSLQKIGLAITSIVDDPEEVLRSVAEGATRVTGADCVTLYVYDHNTNEFSLPVGVGLLDPARFGKSRPKKDGIAPKIVAGQMPIIADDVGSHPDFKDLKFPKRENVMSSAGFPLIARGNVVGVLFVNFRIPHYFTSEDEKTIKTFADQAAIAIENARLFGVSLQRVDEIQRLAEVGHHILTSPVDLRQVLQEIVDQALAALGADLVILYRYYQAQREFDLPTIRAGKFLDSEFPEHAAVSEDDIAFKIVNSGEPRYAIDAVTDEMMTGQPSTCRVPGAEPFVIRERIASSAGIPLKAADETVGVMFVNYRTSQDFDDHQMTMIDMFANYAAIAIQNARLFEQVRSDRDRRIEELNALVAIDEVITTQNLDAVLDRILEAALTIIGAPNGNILLVDENCDYVEIRSTRGEPWAEGTRTKFKIGEHGITGWVAAHREPLRIPDVQADEWQGIYIAALPDTRSELAVPLLDENDELLGVINLESPQTNAFSTDDERLLEALARQAVIAIRNAEQVTDLQKSKEWLEAYSVIDKAIVESVRVGTNLDDVLQLILEKGMEITRSPCGNVMWHDEARGDLVMRAQKGVPSEDVDARQNIGEGIVGLAARRMETVVVADVTEPPWSDVYLPFIPDMHSELATPMVVGERLLGVLNVEHPEVDAFDVETQRRLEALARQAVIAIQNVTRYEALERRTADVEALQEVGRAITATLDVDKVLNLILDDALKLTGAEIGSIRLVDRTTNALVLRISRIPQGVTVDRKWTRVPVGQGITGGCAEHGTSVIVRDTKREPKYIPYFRGMRSEIVVPLMRGEEALGVINLESPEVGAFNEHDKRLLTALADQAVVAIQNAERFEQVVEGQKKLQALREVDQAIVGTLDLDRVLKLVLEKGLEITGAEWGDLTLFGADGRDAVTYAVVEKRLHIERVVKGKTPEWEVGLTKGIVNWVAQEKQPYLSQGDVQKDSRYRGFPYIHAEVAVPLVGGDGALVGVLNLESEQVDHFDEDDVEILQAFAGQTVLAVQNARYFEETRRAQERFKTLSEVGREIINAPLDVDTVLAIVLETGLARTGAHSASARLWDEEKRELKTQVRRGVSHKRAWEPMKLGEGVNGWVAQHKKTCLVLDVENPPDGVKFRRGVPETRSELVVPLLVGSRYFGNLDFGHPEKNGFDEEEVKLIKGLADQAAAALQRARQHAELEAIRRREMEMQFIASIGHSAMEIAHRIGNQVGPVKSYVNLIREEVTDGSKTTHWALDRILEDTGVLRTMSDRLKEELRKFREGEKRAPIPALDVLRSCVEGYTGTLADVDVSIDCPPDMPPVWVNPNQAFDVFFNLFKNAVEATSGAGGRISLRARDVGRYIEFQVEDTGTGIPQDKLNRVFDLFYSTKKGGFGFGLWSTKRMVLAMGGNIDVESEEGRGTTFTVRLPKVPEDESNG